MAPYLLCDFRYRPSILASTPRFVWICVLCVAACSAGIASAQSAGELRRRARLSALARQVSTQAEIDVFCDRLARINQYKRHHLLATTSTNGEPAEWKAYASDAALKKRVRESLGTYSVAEIWKRPDRALHVEITSASDTGDWSSFVRYCYRVDGSLARTTTTMTSYGEKEPMLERRKRYFALDGSAIDPSAAGATQGAVTDPIYAAVDALPFWALIE